VSILKEGLIGAEETQLVRMKRQRAGKWLSFTAWAGRIFRVAEHDFADRFSPAAAPSPESKAFFRLAACPEDRVCSADRRRKCVPRGTPLNGEIARLLLMVSVDRILSDAQSC
jgi:hypothetical protein